jgi:hypothetical protein
MRQGQETLTTQKLSTLLRWCTKQAGPKHKSKRPEDQKMADRYWARIEFPAHLIDEDVKAALEREGVEFDANGPVEPESDTEISVDDGIFSLSDPEVAWGQFVDLESLLKKKGIPFDRESGQAYEYTPEAVIFRPGINGNPPQDLHFLLCEGQPIVEVQKIRELLQGKPDEAFDGATEMQDEVDRIGLVAYQKLIDLVAYLDEHFPAYPPLSDYVKEG